MTRPRLAVTAVALGLGLLAAGCTASRSSSGIPHSFAAGTYRLIAFNSCDDALTGLRSAASAMVGTYGGFGGPVALDDRAGPPVPSAAQPQAASAPGAAGDSNAAKAGGAESASDPAYSGTNSHEAAADEPDLVKTDGHRIVTLTGSTLRVVDAAGRRLTGLIDLAAAGVQRGTPGELLLFGDHALVLMRAPVMYATPMPAQVGPGSAGGASDAGGAARVDLTPVSGSELVLVDLAGPPTVLSTVHVSADLLDARQTGATARVVLTSSPHIPVPAYQRNQTAEQRTAAVRGAIAQAGLDAWLPSIEVTTGAKTTKVGVDCDDISRPETYSATSIMTVLSFDLDQNELGDGRPVVLAADGNTVYGTGPTLYVATDQRWMPTATTNGAAKVLGPSHTEIYKFDTTGARPVFVAGGTVPGNLINQYAMSEWHGNLRVASTSTTQPSPTARATTQSGVYVLAQDGEHLTVKGSVEGLGKGERIYAVRFVGPVGYVVTFRQTDPLYTVDISDPAHPAVKGELKIPGYSAYLHPADGSRLIGVGQNANAQGRVSGTQVSLFDVGDVATPARLATYTLSGAHSEAEFDPHAFLYWPASGLLVIPLQQSYAVPVPVPPVPTNDTKGVAVPAKVAPSFGALVLRVNGASIAEVGFVTHPSGGDFYYSPQIQRSLIIDRTLWTVSAGGLLASDSTTLARQAWVPFN